MYIKRYNPILYKADISIGFIELWIISRIFIEKHILEKPENITGLIITILLLFAICLVVLIIIKFNEDNDIKIRKEIRKIRKEIDTYFIEKIIKQPKSTREKIKMKQNGWREIDEKDEIEEHKDKISGVVRRIEEFTIAALFIEIAIATQQS